MSLSDADLDQIVRGDWTVANETIELLVGELRRERAANNSDRIDMVHELHTALYGKSWARPETPQQVWTLLLGRVEDQAADVVALRQALTEAANGLMYAGDEVAAREALAAIIEAADSGYPNRVSEAIGAARGVLET